ncbi:EamA family transporter [Streptosporangiaceae bacterium NEAU-GS5]|nr:EamA family transporter [Streptosporangiaceae bacterium NEAU-GS5]
MNAAAIALVLGAAVAHAAWNLFSKQAADSDSVVFLWLVALCEVVIWSVPAIVSATPPSPIQILAMCASALLHLGYFLMLQHGYRHGDLSLVYPLARGTGPMLSSVAAVLVLGERPDLVEAAGIGLVGVGIFALGMPRRRMGRPPVAAITFGLGTGLFIAAYTILDATSVKRLGVNPLLMLMVDSLGQVVLMAPTVAVRRALARPLWREHRWRIVATAVLSPLSYLMVLIALRIAPVSAVAPMREVSVLLGVILGGRLLAEGHLKRRLLAAGIIVGGVVAIGFG